MTNSHFVHNFDVLFNDSKPRRGVPARQSRCVPAFGGGGGGLRTHPEICIPRCRARRSVSCMGARRTECYVEVRLLFSFLEFERGIQLEKVDSKTKTRPKLQLYGSKVAR